MINNCLMKVHYSISDTFVCLCACACDFKLLLSKLSAVNSEAQNESKLAQEQLVQTLHQTAQVHVVICS